MSILYSIQMVAEVKGDNLTNEKDLEEKIKKAKDLESYYNSVEKLKEIISNDKEIILEIYGEKVKLELKDLLSKEKSFYKFKIMMDSIGVFLEKKIGIETSCLGAPGSSLLLASSLLKGEEFKKNANIFCKYQVIYRLDQKKISEIASELNITESSNKEDFDKFYIEVMTRFKSGLIKCEETIFLPKEISKSINNQQFDNSMFEKQIPMKFVDKDSGFLFSDEFETLNLTEIEQKAVYIIKELGFYLEKENLKNNIKIVKGVSTEKDSEILENLKNILTLWPSDFSRVIVQDLLFQSLMKFFVM